MAMTKEGRAAYDKARRAKKLLEDPDFDIKKNQKYKKNQKEWIKTPAGKKSRTISSWKYLGLIGDYDQIYERYINTSNCNVCNYQFDESNWRCMDHNHETGIFRQILCHKCNVMDSWKRLIV
jgi:hypothetical protein